MPKRIAAIDVSHWHSAYDAAYLRILCDLGCEIVGVSDRSGRIATKKVADKTIYPAKCLGRPPQPLVLISRARIRGEHAYGTEKKNGVNNNQ